jgi:glucose-6-phosphate 1-dehydrogenase
MDKAEFDRRATSYIKNQDNKDTANAIESFKTILSYVDGDYQDGAAFDNLREHLEGIESSYQSKESNRIFYLALPPTVFIPVAKNLKEHCYNSKAGVNRIIIEKPFGKDIGSARELLDTVNKYWKEEETYRIDHYLGKEMVKNLLVLRFANVAMGAAWDKNSISNVQITFKEPFGTEGRGGYFDEFGIIRDILQNRKSYSPRCYQLVYPTTHADLLQVLTILTMERPVSFSAEDIRDEKVRYFFQPTESGN